MAHVTNGVLDTDALTSAETSTAVGTSLNTAMPATLTASSPNCSLAWAGGKCVAKVTALNPGVGAQTENLFTVSAPAHILAIWGVVGTVTDSTTFSNVKFELDDGAAQDDICTAVDGSGCVEGAVFARDNKSNQALEFIDAAAASVTDPALTDAFFNPFVIVPKTSGTTYIRLSYTADAATDLSVTWMVRYGPLTSSSLVAAV